MSCQRGCGQTRGAIRPIPAPPTTNYGSIYEPGTIIVDAGSDLFSELVLTSAVRDLPNREFIILSGTPAIWGFFPNVRVFDGPEVETSFSWTPITPFLTRSRGHDVFQIAADRFREAGIVIDRGPSLCHLPSPPDPGRKPPDGVLIVTGEPGTIGILPPELVREVTESLSGGGVRVTEISGVEPYETLLKAILGAEIVVCPPGAAHLISCGAYEGQNPEHGRKTILLMGGAWPGGGLPGIRQVVLESWHRVPCSGGGCGCLLAGEGPKASDRCHRSGNGVPYCMERYPVYEIVSAVESLL